MWRWSVLILAGLYTVGYGVWRSLLLTPWYERYWQLQLSELFGSWFYLPLLPLVLLALLTWNGRAFVLLLLPLFLFSAEYGRQFLPNWQPTANDLVSLRVLTWNALYTGDSNGEFQALLRQVRPDFVAIEEVNPRLVRLFEQKLVTDYPFRTAYAAGSNGGLALFSRYPLWVVEKPVEIVSCQCLVVESEVAGRRVTLIVVHIWRPDIGVNTRGRWPAVDQFNSRYQTPIFDKLRERVAAVNGPLVVLGDLNTTERQPNYLRLRHDLQDAFAEAGWGMGYTFPANARWEGWSIPPFVRIDHILINESWEATAAWTGRLPASDHGYVVADLRLE
jgi:endonuclease/exonuclease/phosphatase (EEP) superfamily protein YafD